MNRTTATLARISMVAGVAACGLFWSGELPIGNDAALVSTAQARIGRPLTPMSYAGVARRTTRRAYGYGAYAPRPVVVAPRPVVVAPRPVVVAPRPVVAAPAVVAPAVVAPPCVQVVDVYGRLTYRCR
jgi:hypothetical protein